jgi:NADPH:quinone reductase-like Zn-dependent oxidoreductase
MPGSNVPLTYVVARSPDLQYVGVSPADVACLNIQHKNTTPGFEFSGVVVDDKSGRWSKGQEVCGMAYGGLGSTLKDGEHLV